MKKWMKYLLIPALLITALFSMPVSAKNIATAVLDKAPDSNNVTVALDFSETKTEIITTLRFKLLIAVEEGELAQDDVSFTFAGIPGEVKDAKITYDADVTDYIVDVVISGKENIFQNAVGVPLTIGTLNLPDGDAYSAEVGLVAYDDGSGTEVTEDLSGTSQELIEADEEADPADTVSVLEYVENAGLDVMKIQMKADKQVNVGKTAGQQQTEAPSSGTVVQQTEAAPTVTSFSKQAKPVLTVTAVTGTKKLKFSWEQISGADGYDIAKYNSKRKIYEKIATVSAKKTTYTAKFEFGKTYKFKIRAYKKTKKGKYKYSSFSDAVKVKTSAFDKKKRTTLKVKGKADNSRVRLKWSQLRGADGYKLYQYDSASGGYRELATVEGGKHTSYTVEGDYVSLKTYRFMIRAFARNASGGEVLGAQATAAYKAYPGKVTGLSAEADEKAGVILRWNKVRHAKGYFIFRSKTGKNGSFKEIAQVKGGKKLSYADETVDSGSYYYVVRAYAPGENGSYRRSAPCDAVFAEFQ